MHSRVLATPSHFSYFLYNFNNHSFLPFIDKHLRFPGPTNAGIAGTVRNSSAKGLPRTEALFRLPKISWFLFVIGIRIHMLEQFTKSTHKR